MSAFDDECGCGAEKDLVESADVSRRTLLKAAGAAAAAVITAPVAAQAQAVAAQAQVSAGGLAASAPHWRPLADTANPAIWPFPWRRGPYRCTPLIDSSKMNVNLGHFPLFCEAQPGGGPSEHFHLSSEEMFTLLTGASCLSIDSHSSLIKAPAGAPSRMGHSHGNVNITNENIHYINYHVDKWRGHAREDAFNLYDSRLHATLDPVPQFMVMYLDKSVLVPTEHYHGGQGSVRYRRALDGRDIFQTNWAYMDHEVIPPGASDGLHYHRGVEEIYFVMEGGGTFQLNDETAAVHKWQAVPVRYDEAHSITNNGSSDLELLIMGVSFEKNCIDTELGRLPRSPAPNGNFPILSELEKKS